MAASAKPVTSRPDEVSARLAAAAQGSRVQVTSLDDETSSTYVNADGTFTTKTSTSPIRVRQGNKLVAVDYTLEHVDGGWSPKASPVPVTFSDGADHDAASIGSASKTVALSWNVTLPKPTITADTATYDLGDGESLVLTAGPTGFEQSLVLAHAPRSLPKIKLPLDTAGLDMSAAKGGGYKFTNSSGALVYEMPLPTMFGHSIDPMTEQPSQSSPVTTTLTQTADGAELDLSPSLAWLQAAGRSYPVTIDPSITLSDNGDSYVSEGDTTNNNGSNVLHAGWFSSHAARTYIQSTSGISSLKGKHVTKVLLNLYNNSSMSCTARTINAYPLTADYTSGTVWTNRPAFTTSATYAGSGSFAHGFSSSCNNAWAQVDVTKIIDGWANGGLANHGIQLSGTESSGNQGWGFCSQNPASSTTTGTACNSTAKVPYFTATYNSFPSGNTGRGVSPCTSQCSAPVLTNTTTPSLSDVFTDADGGSLRYDMEVRAGTAASPGSTVQASGSVNTTSGTRAAWKVPTGKLANGGHYVWRDRAFDGTDYGPWSSTWQQFDVDTTAPAVPSLSSTTWTDGQWASDTSGTVAWSDTSADVSGYSWQLDSGAWSGVSAATSHAFSNLANDSLHTVSVKAVDKAGNYSTAGKITFGVGTGGLTSPSDGDATHAFTTLTARAPSATPYVYFQWRQGSTSAWQNIPADKITIPGSSTSPTTWPVIRADSTTNSTTPYIWDVRSTVPTDGDVEVQACLSANSSGTNATCQGDSTHLQLGAHTFDSSNATTDIGPGTLSLQTGDLSVAATDVNETAYNSTLSISRVSTTLDPARLSSDAPGIFGPGWTSSLTGPDAGDAGQTPTIVAADRSSITFLDGDHGQTVYTAVGSLSSDTVSYLGEGDAAVSGARLSYSWRNPTNPAVPHIALVDLDGSVTTWTKPTGGSTWTPLSVVAGGVGAQTTTSYYYNPNGLPSRIVAPAEVDCSTLQKADATVGCRSLLLSYDTVTTSAGNVVRLSTISLEAAGPGDTSNTITPIAMYDYDDTGRLAHEWDPRVSPNLKNGYRYYTAGAPSDGACKDTDQTGRLCMITPPGLAAWTLLYDAKGRLSKVSRPDPSGATATSAVAYDLPLTGAGLPDATATKAATWAQTSDLPTSGNATAVFNPDHVPATPPSSGDWPYASITYMDVNGRAVDNAQYGAGAWQIDTTSYDAYGNVIWSLSAGNRAQALNPTADTDPYVSTLSDSADRAQLLADVSTYNTQNPTVPAGSELLDEVGPMHQIVLRNQDVVDARTHTVTHYDDGAPTNGVDPTTGLAYMLVTRTTTSAVDTMGADHDSQTSTVGYDPLSAGDTSGWKTGLASSQTDPSGQTVKVRYDSLERVVERRLAGDPNGSGPRTMVNKYYTAASGGGSCGGQPSMSGLLCTSGPASQPSTGKALPVVSYLYNMYGELTRTTESFGNSQTTRTSTNTYDAAERIVGSATAVSPQNAGDTSLPPITFAYDATNGIARSATAGSQSVSTTFDSNGRPATYTDGSGSTSSTKYDIDGRIVEVNDGKGTTSYNYDSASEHRGLITSENIGVANAASTFTAYYDAASQLRQQTYPNGVTATNTFDNAGNPTARVYAKDGTDWLTFETSIDANDRVASQSSPLSSQKFTYDQAGRLSGVADTVANSCTARAYDFDADSNRVNLKSYPAGADGNCSTAGTPSIMHSNYDQADRLTSDDNGTYSYDDLGRETAIPAADAINTGSRNTVAGDVGVSYFANDMVAGEHQGSSSIAYTLDPLQTRIATIDDGSVTTTNHYFDSSDSPVWTSTGTQGWTRKLRGPDGGYTGDADQDGKVAFSFLNLHGDVVGTMPDQVDVSAPSEYSETTEFGVARDATVPSGKPYGWLGGAQRSTNSLGGLTLMGARLYSPLTGRFTSVDPVLDGNTNPYLYPTDPINDSDTSGRSSKCKTGYEDGYRITCRWVAKVALESYNKKGHWHNCGSYVRRDRKHDQSPGCSFATSSSTGWTITGSAGFSVKLASLTIAVGYSVVHNTTKTISYSVTIKAGQRGGHIHYRNVYRYTRVLMGLQKCKDGRCKDVPDWTNAYTHHWVGTEFGFVEDN